MNKLLLAVDLFVAMASAGYAGTVEQKLLASLQAQGYVVVEQSYTFLGRLHVVARIGDVQREIVVNPGTGEVLRDTSVTVIKSGPDDAQPAISPDDVLLPDPDAVESLPDVAAEAGEAEPVPDVEEMTDETVLDDVELGDETLSPADGTAEPGGVDEPGFRADEPASALPEQAR